MAELMNADAVAAALESLPGWTGDTERLRRRAQVLQEDQDALVDTVMAAADVMDHHPTIDRDGDRVTFVVRTHSAGGVTPKDVELAARIDDALTGAGPEA